MPCDFLAPIETHNPVDDHHPILLSNFFAQPEALMRGKTESEVRAEHTAAKPWSLGAGRDPRPDHHRDDRTEPEHHDYFARNPWSGYCQVVVAPKVVKFRKQFADRVKREAAAVSEAFQSLQYAARSG